MYSAIKTQAGRVCVDVDGRLTRRARVGLEQSITMVFADVDVLADCTMGNAIDAYTIGGSSLNKTFPAPQGMVTGWSGFDPVDLDLIDEHSGDTCVWSKAYGGDDNDLPAYGYRTTPEAPPDVPIDCSDPNWELYQYPLRLYAYAVARRDPYFSTGDFGIMVEARTQTYDPTTGFVGDVLGFALFKGFKAIRLCDVLDNTFVIPNLLDVFLEDESDAPNLACRGSGGTCTITFNY